MANKTFLDNPEYCMKLYKMYLNEIRNQDAVFKTYFPKWKKDILVLILERAMPMTKRKHLRRKVILDLNRIVEEAFKELEEREYDWEEELRNAKLVSLTQKTS